MHLCTQSGQGSGGPPDTQTQEWAQLSRTQASVTSVCPFPSTFSGGTPPKGSELCLCPSVHTHMHTCSNERVGFGTNSAGSSRPQGWKVSQSPDVIHEPRQSPGECMTKETPAGAQGTWWGQKPGRCR